MKKKLVLHQPWGGLGDNLQFSTLPRRLHKLGCEFNISNKNAYSNDEIKKLVWDINPYVTDSDYDSDPNCGANSSRDILYDVRNVIEWNEARFGLEPKNSTPEIFYQPNFVDALSDKVILDLGGIASYSHNKYDLKNLVYNLNKITEMYDKDKFLVIDSIHSASPITPDPAIKKIKIENIFHYADILMSCKEFVCIYSGSNVLAAAIRKTDTLCLIPDCYSSSKNKLNEFMSGPTCWLFPNNTYVSPQGYILNDLPEWRF